MLFDMFLLNIDKIKWMLFFKKIKVEIFIIKVILFVGLIF